MMASVGRVFVMTLGLLAIRYGAGPDVPFVLDAAFCIAGIVLISLADRRRGQ